jgi:hypothetical protein
MLTTQQLGDLCGQPPLVFLRRLLQVHGHGCGTDSLLQLTVGLREQWPLSQRFAGLVEQDAFSFLIHGLR